jgi:hypothetical protein
MIPPTIPGRCRPGLWEGWAFVGSIRSLHFGGTDANGPAGMREVAWQTVPEPNLAVRLDGSVEYETSDGEVRHVQAGSFVRVEETHGKRPSFAPFRRGADCHLDLTTERPRFAVRIVRLGTLSLRGTAERVARDQVRCPQPTSGCGFVWLRNRIDA